LCGFNGGSILTHEGKVIEEHLVPEQPVRTTLALLERRGVGAWLFADNQWIIKDIHGDYVPKELHTVRFEPTVVDDFEPFITRCGKVVGASAKFDLLAECEHELHDLLHGTANAHRSQKYYLDLTHPDANKGTALHAIAKWYGIDPAEVAAIGDMTNDVPMFHVAGLAIAMGNAPPAVAAEAHEHTGNNETDGWAAAIDRFILPRAP
jgi:Cof subfamily protein (haloacid dehalogenase superfamily)